MAGCVATSSPACRSGRCSFPTRSRTPPSPAVSGGSDEFVQLTITLAIVTGSEMKLAESRVAALPQAGWDADAAKNRYAIDANRELLGLGAASRLRALERDGPRRQSLQDRRQPAGSWGRFDSSITITAKTMEARPGPNQPRSPRVGTPHARPDAPDRDRDDGHARQACPSAASVGARSASSRSHERAAGGIFHPHWTMFGRPGRRKVRRDTGV